MGAPAMDDDWKNKYYLFDLRVYVPGQRAHPGERRPTDPYSVGPGPQTA